MGVVYKNNFLLQTHGFYGGSVTTAHLRNDTRLVAPQACIFGSVWKDLLQRGSYFFLNELKQCACT